MRRAFASGLRHSAAAWPLVEPVDRARFHIMSRAVPALPSSLKRGKSCRFTIFQIGSFKRVLRDVEQKLIRVDLEVLPVAPATRLLCVSPIPPEQSPLRQPGSPKRFGDVQPVRGVARCRANASGCEKRREPIHAHDLCVGY